MEPPEHAEAATGPCAGGAQGGGWGLTSWRQAVPAGHQLVDAVPLLAPPPPPSPAAAAVAEEDEVMVFDLRWRFARVRNPLAFYEIEQREADEARRGLRETETAYQLCLWLGLGETDQLPNTRRGMRNLLRQHGIE
ncbi:MAG: hypothetical protein GY772_16435 [bacterium]|nr:hypothetical protein [bacterium]